MTKAQETLLAQAPAEWEFVPESLKGKTAALARMRALRLIDYRFMPDSASGERKMQWRKRQT